MDDNMTNAERKVYREELKKDIKPGDRVVLEGVIQFARIATMIEGEELERKIVREKAFGNRFYPRKPHTSLTLRNVRIKVKDQENIRPIEKLLRTRLYRSKKHPEYDLMWNMDNKSPFVPRVAVALDDNTLQEIVLPKDPAVGQKVNLILSTYRNQSGSLSWNLDLIIFPNEDIKYYTAQDSLSKTLGEFGYEFKPLSRDERNKKLQRAQANSPISRDLDEDTDEYKLTKEDLDVNNFSDINEAFV